MTAALALFVALTAPVQGGPPVAGYYTLPYSPAPESIGTSISGPGSVVKTSHFVHAITMTDKDTFIRSSTGQKVVMGTSKFLVISVDPITGIQDQDGNATFRAFHQYGDIAYPTLSDASIVAEVTFQHDTLAPDAYPLTRRVRYHVSDPVQGPTSANPRHIKDTPGITVGKNVEVVAA